MGGIQHLGSTQPGQATHSWAQALMGPLGPVGHWGSQRQQECGSELGTGKAALILLEKQNLGMTGE